MAAWCAALVPSERHPADLVERWTALEEHHVSRAERGEISWQQQRRERLRELFALLERAAVAQAACAGRRRHVGASACGLTGVWLDRFGGEVPAAVDVVVRDLSEVLDLLARQG
jgi:hypothetical protein